MATFPQQSRALIDFPQLSELLHDFAFYFPATSATQVSRRTKLDFRALSFVARKEVLSVNARILLNKMRDSLSHLAQTAIAYSAELDRCIETLQFSLYLYENQSYSPAFSDHLRAKYGDLEAEFDLREHLRLSLTLLKKKYLNEPIKDPSAYLKYLDINNKRAHRDYLFADIRRIFFGDQSHIEEINTAKLFDFRNSKKVKAEIESHLRAALAGVQEPQDAVVS